MASFDMCSLEEDEEMASLFITQEPSSVSDNIVDKSGE